MLGLSWSLALLLCGLFLLSCSLFNVPDVRLSGRAPHLVPPFPRLIISTILHRPFKNIKLNVRINRNLILRTWKDEDDSTLSPGSRLAVQLLALSAASVCDDASTRTYIKLSGQCQLRDGYFVFSRDNYSMKTCFCAPSPPVCSRVFSILFQPSERG